MRTCGAQVDAAAMFQEKCAQCHGAHGQGVADGHAEPLLADQSIAELTQLIEDTMPEDSPEECVGEAARELSVYIREQLNAKGVRRNASRLTHLTVEQYRNVIADTIGRFAPASNIPSPARRNQEQVERPPRPDGPGLLGEYYQSKGMSKANSLAFDRVDARISFDFGEASPADNITADQFSIIWRGGLITHDTGYYEFRLTTQNGARLYLNFDPKESLRKLRDDSSAAGQQALIDAWVGSGQMRERAARVFLLGGRTYPIRFEFFKYTMEETSSVRLEWKPPHGIWSVLDHNHTTTVQPARVYVCDTPFPADDRSLGYERGSFVSPAWQVATTDAAIAAAAEVVGRLPLLAKLTKEVTEREKLVGDFVLQFAATAFRRPLTNDERTAFAEVALSKAGSIEAVVHQSILMILMSPHFLYTDLTPAHEAPSPHTIASRLSLALWDSIPDRVLTDAANNGGLDTIDEIQAQADRLLGNPRAKAKMRNFFLGWLEIEYRDLAKDKQMFPEFDESVVADLRRSLELFFERVVWSKDSDYRQLLLADYLILNDRLRGLYGPDNQKGADDRKNAIASPGDQFAAEFQPMVFPASQRTGVLTHPYLLSAFAYHNNTSPIHRGVFLTRNIVGRTLSPPPMAVAFKNDEFAADLTMREKITQLTRDTACMSCHSVINPLGFTLENYDAVGRWRTSDNNKPVNTRSEYTTEAGEVLQVASARDVANVAVSSASAHQAFITHLFQYTVKQDPAMLDPELIDRLTEEFSGDDYNIQHLWGRIATIAAGYVR